MAERLIEKLIVKVSVQGAAKGKKSLEDLDKAIQQAEEDAFEFNSQIRMMDKNLTKLSVTATEASKRLSGINFGFNSAGLTQSLGSIENLLETVAMEAVEFNEALTRMNNDLIHGFSFMAQSLGVDLEKIQDELIDVSLQAKKTGSSFDGLGKKAKGAASGLANSGRQGRNSARTFSDLARIAGPLPMLYAQIAANVFALSEAFRLLTEGEQLNRLEQVGIILGGQIGVPVQTIARDMQALTGHTLSYGDALRQAAAAAAYGFNGEQIEQLTMAARRASIALGIDMQDAMNRVIRGTSKLEIELLDELGITTKLTTAYEKYARTLGVSADSLNAYQQRTALVNEINAQSVEKFGVLDAALKDGAPWEKFGANAATAWQGVLSDIAKATEGVAKFFNEISENDNRVASAKERGSNILGTLDSVTDRAGEVRVLNEMYLELAKIEEDRVKAYERAQANPRANNPAFRETIFEEATELGRAYDMVAARLASTSLGIPNIQAAADAYANLAAVVKGTVPDYDKSLTSIRGQSEAYVVFYQQIENITKAYENLKATDPGADLGESIKKLGFETEAAMYKALDMAEAYRDAKIYSDALQAHIPATAELMRTSGSSSLDIERMGVLKELEATQMLIKSQEELGVEKHKLAQLMGKESTLRMKLLDNDIKRVDESTKKITAEQEVNRAIGPQLLLTKDLLEIERNRLEMLKGIEGSQEAQEQSALRIRQIQQEINSAQLQEYMGIMESSLSNLFSYGTGIDQLTNSLNKLALSFNQVGETSMTAMQMTGVGLQAFQGMLSYTTAQTLSSIEAQINAEQKRDGKSKESLAKIKSLEEKKIREQKKAAQQQILISTAVAVMSAAANPWPMPAIPLMASAALAGGLAYAQASSASSNQLAGLNESSMGASLTVGSRDNKVDVSQNASMGELAFIRGERGMGSSSSFAPRSKGGSGTPYSSLLVGENGPERITPLQPLNVENAEDTANSGSKSGARKMFESLVVHAVDAQSFIDRASDIYEAMDLEARRRGQSLDKLS